MGLRESVCEDKHALGAVLDDADNLLYIEKRNKKEKQTP